MEKNRLFVKKINIFTIFIFLAAIINILLPISQNLKKFQEKFDVKLFEKKYNKSQYVIPQSKTPISDEELLSWAGYQYASGLNPILINSDHPPLGKYIIGWMTLLTGNNRIVSLVFALGNIALLMLIVYSLTRSYFLSTLVFLLASLDTVFIDQIIYSPVLDIIQLFFLLLYFYLLLVWSKSKKHIILLPLGITLGAISAVKIYFPALILLLVTSTFLIFVQKNIKKTAFTALPLLVLAIFTYTITYLRYFFVGNSLRNFLGTQKWIFLFWKNNSIQVSDYYGNVIPLLLLNKWKVWWGTKQYINFEHWSILWPIFFILGVSCALYLLYKGFHKKLPQSFASFLSIWIIVFTLYLCLIPISPRYLMMLYFPLYIVICVFIKLKFNKYVAN